jgi:hypothetical protein
MITYPISDVDLRLAIAEDTSSSEISSTWQAKKAPPTVMLNGPGNPPGMKTPPTSLLQTPFHRPFYDAAGEDLFLD